MYGGPLRLSSSLSLSEESPLGCPAEIRTGPYGRGATNELHHNPCMIMTMSTCRFGAQCMHMYLEILRVNILFSVTRVTIRQNQANEVPMRFDSVRILIRIGYGKTIRVQLDPWIRRILLVSKYGSGPIGRPFGPQNRNNDEKIVSEELDDFLKGRGFFLELKSKNVDEILPSGWSE